MLPRSRGVVSSPFRSFTVAVGAAIIVGAAPATGAGNVDLPRYPSLSPDGTQVVFSWRGDLFIVDADGGAARRLTTHPADDLHSAFSADGSRIAFTSDRNGYLNIYLMNADGTGLRPVTDIDRSCELAGFGVDEQGDEVVTFHSTLEGDVYRDWRPYLVSPESGVPQRVHDAFGSYPRVSPDGRRVVFARGGYYDGWERRHYRGPENIDTWLYDRDDDSFRRLTEHAGNDGKAQWLDDDTLLFLSDRELDAVNLYRMSTEAGGGEAVRLTSFDGDDVHDFSVAPDAARAVLMVWDTLYTLDLDDIDAEPQPISISAVEDERDNFELKRIDGEVSEAALSPDGQVMAVVAYGEVYMRNVEEDSPTRRVTRNHAREKELAWSPDGLRLYFNTDEGDRETIRAATVAQTREEVREGFEEATGIELKPKFQSEKKDEKKKNDEEADTDGAEPADAEAARADDPVSGSWQGNADVPDRGVVAWTLNLKLEPDNSVTGSFDGADISGSVAGSFDPDDRSLDLTISAGEIVITMQLTITNGTMTGTAIADDLVVDITGTRTSTPGEDEAADADEAGADQEEDEDLPKELDPKRWHDALTFNIEPVVEVDFNARRPRPSPDGTMLSFRGTRGDVHIMDLETGETRRLIEGWDAWIDWRWSPDSRYLAYAQHNLNFNNDIFIVPADGSAEPQNISKHPDNDGQPRWSADGRVLSFTSERVDEQYDVWMVFLDEDLEALTREELKDYFEEAAKQAKKRKPLEIERPEKEPGATTQPEEAEEAEEAEDASEEEQTASEAEDEEDADEAEEEEAEPPFEYEELDDAYLRVRRVTRLLGNEGNLEMTPAGDTVIFTAGGDTSGLFSVKWDGTEQKRLSGRADVQHVDLTGGKLVAVSGGRASLITLPGGSSEIIAINDRIGVDLQQQASQKFLEAARLLGEQYYHPDMNGVDWDGLTEKYHGLAQQSRTADEFNWLANRFIGELNGSHLRISARSRVDVQRQVYGYLGTRHERGEEGFKVLAIVDDSPAAKGPMSLQVGDVITAIEFEPFEPGDTLEARLKDQVGKETVISVRRDGLGENGEAVDFEVLLTPISFGQLRQLIYEQWRHDNAELVHEMSDGRLGYIHIQGMSQPSLDVFERDLFAAAYGKDGLVLDVRNNGGGWTTDRVLSSIMVTPHAYTIPRGAPRDERGHYPQDRLFIQRYALPMNLLCNEKSFSNAEIMSHAFKTLDRGTLVGEQTYGGVISTGGWSLIDGTWVRLPFRGWYVTPTDTDMELNGAMPDLHVPQTPEAEAAGEDEQLRAAVEDLLKRLGEGTEGQGDRGTE